MDLALSLANYINDLPDDSEETIDDWFNIVGIPVDQRNDFVVASLFKQIKERRFLTAP